MIQNKDCNVIVDVDCIIFLNTMNGWWLSLSFVFSLFVCAFSITHSAKFISFVDDDDDDRFFIAVYQKKELVDPTKEKAKRERGFSFDFHVK